jgi:hypothetical protein
MIFQSSSSWIFIVTHSHSLPVSNSRFTPEVDPKPFTNPDSNMIHLPHREYCNQPQAELRHNLTRSPTHPKQPVNPRQPQHTPPTPPSKYLHPNPFTNPTNTNTTNIFILDWKYPLLQFVSLATPHPHIQAVIMKRMWLDTRK